MATKGRPASETPHIFVPDGSMDGWYQAKALAVQQPAWITVLGTSVSTGQGGSNWMTKGCFELVRSSLLNSLPLYADLWTPIVFSTQTGAFVGTPPFVHNQAPSTIYLFGWNRVGVYSGNIPGACLTFTSPAPCVALDIVYMDYQAGTFTYTIDGGAPVTVTTTGPGTTPGSIIKKISVTGLANTTHTVVLGAQSATNVLIPQAITCYARQDVGIGFARLSYPGAKAVDYALSTYSPADKAILWQGVMPQGASPTSPTGFGFPTQPHLAIIELGINDETSQTGIDQFRGAHRRLIQALRRGRDNCSIILLAASLPDGSNSDVTGGGNNPDWWRYIQVLSDLARSFNCVFLDVHSRWGELGANKGFQAVGDIHPLDAGHADMAAMLLSIL